MVLIFSFQRVLYMPLLLVVDVPNEIENQIVAYYLEVRCPLLSEQERSKLKVSQLSVPLSMNLPLKPWNKATPSNQDTASPKRVARLEGVHCSWF